MRPRARVHLALDAQHRAQVPAAHRHDVHRERLDGLSRRRHSPRPSGPTSISASLWRRYSGSTSRGRLELLALDARGRQLDQRGGARRGERRAGELGAVERRRTRSRKRGDAVAARAAAPRRAAASSADEVVGRADLVLGDALHAAGHRAVAARRTPRGGGRRAPATTSAARVAQRVRDEVEARAPATTGMRSAWAMHLGRRHADAQPGEQAGADADRDRRRAGRASTPSSLAAGTGSRARAARRAGGRRRAAPRRAPRRRRRAPTPTRGGRGVDREHAARQPVPVAGVDERRRARRRAPPTTARRREASIDTVVVVGVAGRRAARSSRSRGRSALDRGRPTRRRVTASPSSELVEAEVVQLLEVVEPVHVDVRERHAARRTRARCVNVGLTTGSVDAERRARCPSRTRSCPRRGRRRARRRRRPAAARRRAPRARASRSADRVRRASDGHARARPASARLTVHEVGAGLRERGAAVAQHRGRVQRRDEHRAVAERELLAPQLRDARPWSRAAASWRSCRASRRPRGR